MSISRIVSAVILASIILFGCSKSRKENLLANADFSAWTTPTAQPASWRVEGQALNVKKTDFKVEKTGTAALELTFLPDAVVLNSPFFYQGASDTARLWGRKVRAGAWMKTDTPDAVFIEVSNRAGVDVKSRTHPGGGKWEYLDLYWDVPDKSQTVEVRVRFRHPSTVLLGNPSLTID